MTNGTSQGLYIVVAIVIFGIFTLMAYILFEDTLSPSLAFLFGDATEKSMSDLNKDKDNSTPVNTIPPEEATVPKDTIIPFSEGGVRDAIIANLGLSGDTITLGDLERLESLTIPVGVTITKESLEGLQYAKNLKEFKYLGSKDLPDINVLGILPVKTVLASTILSTKSSTYAYSEMLYPYHTLEAADKSASEMADSDIVFIRDIFLREAIRKELRIFSNNPITFSDMKKLTSLDVFNKGILTLQGLEYAVNLTYLDISHNYLESDYTEFLVNKGLVVKDEYNYYNYID